MGLSLDLNGLRPIDPSGVVDTTARPNDFLLQTLLRLRSVTPHSSRRRRRLLRARPAARPGGLLATGRAPPPPPPLAVFLIRYMLVLEFVIRILESNRMH